MIYFATFIISLIIASIAYADPSCDKLPSEYTSHMVTVPNHVCSGVITPSSADTQNIIDEIKNNFSYTSHSFTFNMRSRTIKLDGENIQVFDATKAYMSVDIDSLDPSSSLRRLTVNDYSWYDVNDPQYFAHSSGEDFVTKGIYNYSYGAGPYQVLGGYGPERGAYNQIPCDYIGITITAHVVGNCFQVPSYFTNDPMTPFFFGGNLDEYPPPLFDEGTGQFTGTGYFTFIGSYVDTVPAHPTPPDPHPPTIEDATNDIVFLINTSPVYWWPITFPFNSEFGEHSEGLVSLQIIKDLFKQFVQETKPKFTTLDFLSSITIPSDSGSFDYDYGSQHWTCSFEEWSPFFPAMKKMVLFMSCGGFLRIVFLRGFTLNRNYDD